MVHILSYQSRRLLQLIDMVRFRPSTPPSTAYGSAFLFLPKFANS